MLGQRLKQLRKQFGLTQEEIANKLNISRGTYAHYELDRREPNYETVSQLASFFNVSIDYLLGKSDTNNAKIIEATAHNVELGEFAKALIERESMQLLFEQVKSLPDAEITEITKIIKIMKAIEDEENRENGVNNN